MQTINFIKIKPKILQPQHINFEDLNRIGGKARNLKKMTDLGLNVPNWVVLPDNIMGENPSKELIESIEFDDSFLTQLESIFPKNTLFAVRSSASLEDGENHSFAGQFNSFLFVKKVDLSKTIRKVLLSVFSNNVQSYLTSKNIKSPNRIAVIIQEMVNAEVSGVGFGMNPVNGDRNEKVISSVFGLGEGLVSGELDADTFIYKDGKIESKIVEKKYALVHDFENGGLMKKDVPEFQNPEHLKSSLNDSQIQKIAETLDLLKRKLGKPQDIEFAFTDNQFYLFQTRPITNLAKIPDQNGQRIVWDNSNIIESYPGVTTPLTFSFILKVYEAVYRQFVKMMGVSERTVEENQAVFANMLGLIRGRVYYNLKSWYRTLAMLPGYSVNAQFMETMMGVKEKFRLENQPKISKWKAIFRLLFSIFKILKNLWTLPRQRREFMKLLDKTVEEYQQIDFENSRPDQLANYYTRLEAILLKEWKAPLVNDFFAMIYFGLLQKMTAKWVGESHPNLHNDLLAGNSNIISTEPVKRILEISNLIQKDENSTQFFKENSPEIIWKDLENDAFPNIKNTIDNYLQKFGERCVGELKLETVSFSQDPIQFIKIIQSYVQNEVKSSVKAGNLEQEIRENAVQIVKKSLKGEWFKQLIFNYLLNMTRDLVSNRENLRYERTRAFGLVRAIFTSIGKNFYSEGIIENSRDIFYLKKEEIFDYLNGTAVQINLKELIQIRKTEFDQYKIEKAPSERITTYGLTYHGNDFYQVYKNQPIEGDLKGIGCCPGRVKAKVQVIRHPDEIQSLNGDILVTSSTDPGWVTLFPSASAIMVERGSLLSHSAIVSRELGIPCIVSISGLLDTLKTGDLVEMDGSTGEIKLLNI